MNWYKKAQLYEDVKRTDFLDDYDGDDMFNASQYFSIGQNEETTDKSYCWIWIDNNLYYKIGGSHNMNFRHLISTQYAGGNIELYYRGWYDPIQKLCSIIIPIENRPTGNYYFTENDIPEELDNALRNQFGYKFKYVVF